MVSLPDGPKPPSVSASPSAEIEEGSSVTLTCSSDANPAANYTWYKENEDSPKASGQIFNITDFRAEHSGSYSCGAQNKLGRSNSTLHLSVVAGSSTMIVNIIRTTPVVLILIPVFLVGLWMRKKKKTISHPTTEAHEPEEIELDSDPVYENFRVTGPHGVKSSQSEAVQDVDKSSMSRQHVCLEDCAAGSLNGIMLRRGSHWHQILSRRGPSLLYPLLSALAPRSTPVPQSFPTAAFAPVSDAQISLPETLLMLSLCLAPRATCPRFPALPSAEIKEGSSVTLTCSSDANPAATYTWYKEDGNANVPLLSEITQLVLSSIQSSDSGQHYCRAENKLGVKTSKDIFVDVKYSPKLPSVSVSPSAEVEEGSSVTLTCSSDANPAANYIWYKENEDSPKASGQIFTITDFRAEHSGSYSCGAQNKLGRSNSTFHLSVVAGTF
ncbi:hypothetical protein JOQ06_013147 [Pogonophryne albipinna]|uniref:Ig-like domain-containing protein n=1 Tax=Pogonophryne albipinna TaxID=1090488 RepID=A0AAD6BJB6_9TELE|nr:hypothetical protein JOQ06_013147 [Pogonophryne albipinna]